MVVKCVVEGGTTEIISMYTVKEKTIMAIDISTDIVISLLAKDYLTPTITGVYDSG